MKLTYLSTVTFKFALLQRNVIQNPASVPIFLFSVPSLTICALTYLLLNLQLVVTY
jgi:hypothetical protein